MGYKVGLHTAGCYPEQLDELLPAVDWAGLDIKALPEDYRALTGVRGSGERALDSLDYLVESGVPHEVRVTVHDALLPPDKLQRLIDLLAERGVAEITLQRCRTQHVLDPDLGDNTRPWRHAARCTTVDQWRLNPLYGSVQDTCKKQSSPTIGSAKLRLAHYPFAQRGWLFRKPIEQH